MIEFKHIEIKYGDFVAIRDLNLTIGDGEFFTFLGPSGWERQRRYGLSLVFWSPARDRS